MEVRETAACGISKREFAIEFEGDELVNVYRVMHYAQKGIGFYDEGFPGRPAFPNELHHRLRRFRTQGGKFARKIRSGGKIPGLATWFSLTNRKRGIYSKSSTGPKPRGKVLTES